MRCSFVSRAGILLVMWRTMPCGPSSLAAQEVFVRVPVELGGTATRATLPFGEPFVLVGAAPAEYRRVDARYLLWTTQPPTQENCDRELEKTITGVRPWVRNPQFPSDSFAVLVVDGLSANRRYGLCMSTIARIGAAGLTAFQDSAFRILNQGFTALGAAHGPPPYSVPAGTIRKLQTQLISALPVPPGHTLSAKGTFFDLDSAVHNTNLILATGVLTAQTNRVLSKVDWDTASAWAHKGLQQLAGSEALRRIAGALSRRDYVPGMDSATVDRAIETARLLAAGDAEVTFAAMQGTIVLDPLAVLPAATAPLDSAEVAARMARLDSTYLRMSELRDLLAAVDASAMLRGRAGVTAPQAAAVQARVDHVRGLVQRVRENATNWMQYDAERREMLNQSAGALRLTAEHQVSLVGTSISNFETRARQYVTADLGVAYLPDVSEALPYFGVNFYLGALNKNVPVGYTNELDRWALTVGVTATSLARETHRDDLFSSYSLLVGGGRRMTDAIRVTGGGVVYRSVNRNPLVDDTSITISPFVSLSFDFDARSALGRVGEILSK